MQKLQMTKRKVVTLCGSTRFREQFHMANAQLTMAGYIVLSVGFFLHVEPDHAGVTPAQKVDLDLLHFDKIRMSNGIYVVNVAGYVGASTMREVALAIALNRTIEWLEPDAGNDWMSTRAHDIGAQVARFVEGYVPELMS